MFSLMDIDSNHEVSVVFYMLDDSQAVVGHTITIPATGTIRLEIDAAQSSQLLAFVSYYYRIKITSPLNVVSYPFEGVIRVIPTTFD